MTLPGDLCKRLCEALCSAFDSSGLAQLVRFKLDKDLNAITRPGRLTDVVFELVKHCESEDQIPSLIRGALDLNPRNSLLQECARNILGDRDRVVSLPYPSPLFFVGHERLLVMIHEL